MCSSRGQYKRGVGAERAVPFNNASRKQMLQNGSLGLPAACKDTQMQVCLECGSPGLRAIVQVSHSSPA